VSSQNQEPSVSPTPLRHDWTVAEVEALHALPFPELVYRAQTAHRERHDPSHVQACTLLSIKTGGCPEDCGYCPQSAHYETGVERRELLDVGDVLEKARTARENGASRFCMGAAWRDAPEGRAFEQVLACVKGVSSLGLEACVTLGMLTDEQAERLAAAGLTAYNHNLDTSREHYAKVVRTRTYDERLATLERVRNAGISVCCGGILGLGESVRDRCALLVQLSSFDPHPESVPINVLVRSPGTPMEHNADVDPLDLVRTVAAARLVLPASRIRLSAGRTSLSAEAQALCFLAGASSIFLGDTLLTTPNPAPDEDARLFERLGIRVG
jgi:biotin synthase